MHIVFVHGWSVRSTDTYGDLPKYLDQLPALRGSTVSHIFLGKYVSFEDTVTLDDIARAFDAALRDAPALAGLFTNGEKFAAITHSTGGPVIRQWFDRFHAANPAACPMSHLIMLAPANHGSALAQLGKGRLSRIKSYFDGVAPGQRVLDWLELGSDAAWALNLRWMAYDLPTAGIYPFVLTGQSIDRSFYDVLNSYTDEVGSDGVVRIAAANLNYGFLQLRQRGEELAIDSFRESNPCALAILPGLSHSGDDMGIIRSVKLGTAQNHPTVKAIMQCLAVDSQASYNTLSASFGQLSTQTQEDEETRRARIGLFNRTFPTPRCSMLLFRISDDTGQPVADYDLIFTAGPEYDSYSLPSGFFIDRQRNQRNPGKLTYYLNYDILIEGLSGRLDNNFGITLSARPEAGLARYQSASFKGTGDNIVKALRANETLMIDIIIERLIDRQVFTLTQGLDPAQPIIDTPSGKTIPPLTPHLAQTPSPKSPPLSKPMLSLAPPGALTARPPTGGKKPKAASRKKGRKGKP